MGEREQAWVMPVASEVFAAMREAGVQTPAQVLAYAHSEAAWARANGVELDVAALYVVLCRLFTSPTDYVAWNDAWRPLGAGKEG